VLEVLSHVGQGLRFVASAAEQRHERGIAVHRADVVKMLWREPLGREPSGREAIWEHQIQILRLMATK
jgi:hypothetical protein